MFIDVQVFECTGPARSCTLQHKVFYSERLINDIYDGIARKQFEVYYQPKYGILEGKPVLKMAEALIRWNHPEFGRIAPLDFISLFEENGLIQMLDHFVWKEAASRIKYWKDKFGVTIPVSVNVSRLNFYNLDLLQYLLGLVEKYGLSGHKDDAKMAEYWAEVEERYDAAKAGKTE